MSKKGNVPAENEEVETPENTEVETPENTEAPAKEPVEGEPKEGEEEPAEGEEPPKEGEEPAFVPNFKYKVMDQEKEVDERLKGIIKTKEDEDFVRDLLTKAEGLEAFKTVTHAKLQEKHTALEQDYREQVIPYVQEIENTKKLVTGQTYEQRDYHTFFQKLGIPTEHILKYTKSILDYQDASPEQRAAIDNQRNVQLQLRQQEEQSQFFQSQNQQFAVQARTFELNQELTKPEVNSFASAFDSLHGNGAFRNQVINQGALIFHTQKKDVAPSELVRLVMENFKGITAVQPKIVTPTNTPANSSAPKTTTPPAKKPVIPVVSGSGGSPAKKVFTSLDEIKAHRKTLKTT